MFTFFKRACQARPSPSSAEQAKLLENRLVYLARAYPYLYGHPSATLSWEELKARLTQASAALTREAFFEAFLSHWTEPENLVGLYTKVYTWATEYYKPTQPSLVKLQAIIEALKTPHPRHAWLQDILRAYDSEFQNTFEPGPGMTRLIEVAHYVELYELTMRALYTPLEAGQVRYNLERCIVELNSHEARARYQELLQKLPTYDFESAAQLLWAQDSILMKLPALDTEPFEASTLERIYEAYQTLEYYQWPSKT